MLGDSLKDSLADSLKLSLLLGLRDKLSELDGLAEKDSLSLGDKDGLSD